jgi:DNA-binding MarR family transcriptional regulator/GNAT superfamily N-acetyltransferase
MTQPDPVAAVRQFNRFYTRRIGVLQEKLLRTTFTLTESRLLWEFAHREALTAAELARELDLDAGYLSRLLRGFKQRGLIKTTRSKDDARHVLLSLTAAGRRAFAPLDEQSQSDVSALLARLTASQQQQLLSAMHGIEQLLGETPAKKAPSFLLRSHRAGDIGWVASRHGAFYAAEYGWNLGFEALVGHIACRFIEQFDAKRECCWIAERSGINVGSVFLVQARDDESGEPIADVAQLRLLLVEPAARGLGIGETLVRECERFARQAGYRTIRLWTQSMLVAARAIYQKAGYVLVASEPHHSFGHELVGEIWELELR